MRRLGQDGEQGEEETSWRGYMNSDSNSEVDNEHGVNVEGDANEKTNHTNSYDLLLVMKKYILSNTKKKKIRRYGREQSDQ